MKRRLWLLGFLFLVPLVAFGVGRLVEDKYESLWRGWLVQRYGIQVVTDRSLALSNVCERLAGTEAGLTEICRDVHLSGVMTDVATAAAAAGLLMLGLIWTAGRLSRMNRTLLLALFRPGLYLTTVILAVLVVTHGLLALASLWYFQSILIETIHSTLIVLMLAIAAGALTGSWAMVKGAFQMLKPLVNEESARAISRERYPGLWQFMDELALRLGTAPPDHILAGLNPNFYVTEVETRHTDGKAKGRIMYLSLPLARILTKSELGAIIGHELAHFRGEDTQFSQRFYPTYRGTINAIHGAVANAGKGWSTVAVLPAVHTFAFFLESFQVAESKIARERELLADQAGAEAAGVQAMASALVKLHAFSACWGDVLKEMWEKVQADTDLPNASAHYAALVQTRSTACALEEVDEQQVPHPTDSHPPLSARLEALGTTVTGVAELALRTEPDLPAITLFGEAGQLEEELTRTERQAMLDYLNHERQFQTP